MVADLENNILSGLVLVVLVIFFAMGIRNAVLVSLAIPFSMLLSFTVLYIMGITLNMVVLFSLTLALGMLVDNAIVIVENIYRFMEQGVPRIEAAMKATSEVAYPVIGSTLTTLAAFFPMLFWPGIMGEFMSYLPLTLIVTLSSSLFVALVINPALASLFVKIRQKRQAAHNAPAEKPLPRWNSRSRSGPAADAATAGCSAFPCGIRFVIMGIALCVLVLMIQGWLLVVGLEKPVEFFPEIEPKGMYVNVDVPEGADLDYIDRIMQRVEMAVADGAERRHLEQSALPRQQYRQALAPKIYTSADRQEYTGPSDLENITNIYMKGVVTAGPGSAFDPNAPNHIGVRFLDLEERQRSTFDTVDDIRERIQDIPGGKITVAMQEEGPPTGAPINIEISGDNFAVLGEIARKIKNIIAKIPHVEGCPG